MQTSSTLFRRHSTASLKAGLLFVISMAVAALFAAGSHAVSPGRGDDQHDLRQLPALVKDDSSAAGGLNGPACRSQGGIASDPCGPLTVTQNLDTATVNPSPSTLVCFSNPVAFTSSNGYARGFAWPTALEIDCVEFGIETNQGGDWPVDVNIYLGDIAGSFGSLVLLDSTTVVVPNNTTTTLFTAKFDESVSIPPATPFVVEVFAATRDPERVGGDGGVIAVGTNNGGQTGPTYIRAPECGVSNFTPLTTIDPLYSTIHLLLNVSSASCAPAPPQIVSTCPFSDVACCEAVCAVFPECCTVHWDCYCAAAGCDCNNNGADDLGDVFGGTSLDCNDNCVPDECEPCLPAFIAGGDSQFGAPFAGTGWHEWTRELHTKRFRFDRNGDLLGKGDHFYYAQASPSWSPGGLYQVLDRADGGLLPGVSKQRDSKNQCNDNDCSANSAACRWNHDVRFLFADQICVRSGVSPPPFPTVDLIFKIVDDDAPSWGLLLYLVALTVVFVSCLGATVLAISGLSPFFIVTAACINFFVNGGPGMLHSLVDSFIPTGARVVGTLLADGVPGNSGPIQSPAPTAGFNQACEHFTLTNTLGGSDARMEVTWTVEQTGQAICSFNHLGAGTTNDIDELVVAHRSHDELFVRMVMEDGDLWDPTTFPASGVRRFEVNFNMDNCFYTGVQERCGADCYVEVVQQKDSVTGAISVEHAVYCSTCSSPCAPAGWAQTGDPYEVFVGHQEVRFRVRLSDLGDPPVGTFFSAYGAVYDVQVPPGGVAAPLDTVPTNICDDIEEMARTPDVNCPRVVEIDGLMAASGHLASPIVMVMSEPIQDVGVGGVSISPSMSVTPTLDATGKRLSLVPSGQFAPGMYTIVLSPANNVLDLAGNALDGDSDGMCGGPYVLHFCISDPHFYPSTAGGTEKREFAEGEVIHVRGTGFPPSQFGALYLVFNHDLVPGMLLADQSTDGVTFFVATAGGTLGTPSVAIGAALNPEEYRVVADLNLNGEYDSEDRAMDLCISGLVVGDPCDQSLEGMVAWWRLDEVLSETGGASAEVIGAHHGTWHGAPHPTQGVVHNGLHFSSALGDYVEVPHHPDLEIEGAFSFEAWIFVEPGNEVGSIIEKGIESGIGGYDLVVYSWAGTQTLNFPFCNATTCADPFAFGAGPAIPINQWVHVAITGGPALDLKAYVNGHLGASAALKGGGLVGTAHPVRIGSGFRGAIDELACYERALEPEEVEMIYMAGAAGRCLDTPEIPGDFDGNGFVDGADLGLMLAGFGQYFQATDLDGNNYVDGADLGILLSNWGP